MATAVGSRHSQDAKAVMSLGCNGGSQWTAQHYVKVRREHVSLKVRVPEVADGTRLASTLSHDESH
jgi:hypothetical protein